MVYNVDYKTVQFCDGTNWISMNGGGGGGSLDGLADVSISSPATNEALIYNGSAWVNTALAVSESDPQVGTLTNGKWCSTDGTAVNCTQDAPAASAGSNTQVIFNNGGTLTGDASLVWDNTNKRLGIGTSTPLNILHIENANPLLRLTDSDTGADFGIDANSTAGALRLRTDFNNEVAGSYTAFEIDGTERMRINSDGNVGIGTSSPTSPLTIFASDNAASAGFKNKTTGTDSIAVASIENDARNWQFRVEGTDADKLKIFDGTAGAYRLSVDNVGNVGIGTTAPAAKLHTYLGASGATPVNGLGEMVLERNTDTGFAVITPSTNIGSIAFGDESNGAVGRIRYMHSSDAMLFYTNAAERMRIDSTGNVGIGTASPVAKLDVRGSNRFDGVDELNWSGHIQGNQTVSVTFTHNNQASFEITAVMNHYGYINTYGCARKALVANGPGVMDVVNIANVTSANGGAWTFTRNSATSVTITKTAGSYLGDGDYFITVRGAQNLSK